MTNGRRRGEPRRSHAGTNQTQRYDPVRLCHATALWEEWVFVILPQAHGLAECSEIGWNGRRDEHFIVSETNPAPETHDYLVKYLAELGRHPTVERCGVRRDNLMKLVTLGQGLTLTSEATTGVAFPGIVYRPIEGERLPFGALGQFERDLIRERTRAGLHAAQARGRLGGRKPVVTEEKLRRACDLIAKGLTVRKAANRARVGKTALCKAL